MKLETNTMSPALIKEKYHELKESHPKHRVRDLAREIGVTEAELLASRVGDGVTRLQDNWKDMLTELKTLGTVTAITRNDYAVQEHTGTYKNPRIGEPNGVFLSPGGIDLRFFFATWKYAFAVQDETKFGVSRSLQFFGKDGISIHKVYIGEESDLAAYDEYISRFKLDVQESQISVEEKAALPVDKADEEIDQVSLQSTWEGLQDAHDFYPMLKQFEVGRVQALRLGKKELAYRVKNDSFRKLLMLARDSKCEILIFVANPGCIQLHSGLVENLKELETWYNVLDPKYNLHVREDAIDQTWVVKKPSKDGIITSVELYDKDNQNFVLIYGRRQMARPEMDLWREIVSKLERT